MAHRTIGKSSVDTTIIIAITTYSAEATVEIAAKIGLPGPLATIHLTARP